MYFIYLKAKESLEKTLICCEACGCLYQEVVLFITSCVRLLSPDSISSLMGVERWDTDPSSSRSSSESSSDVVDMASSLGGGGALAAVFLWSTASSLLLLLLPNICYSLHLFLKYRQVRELNISVRLKGVLLQQLSAEI